MIFGRLNPGLPRIAHYFELHPILSVVMIFEKTRSFIYTQAPLIYSQSQNFRASLCKNRIGSKTRVQGESKYCLGTRCHIPPFKKSMYDASFASLGPRLWNTVLESIISALSLESFKSQLTSHLTSNVPDLPPVSGYTTPNSNFLLDWKRGGLQQLV